MLPLAFLLAIPLLGGVVLGLVGHRDGARDVNVAFSAGTFIAACLSFSCAAFQLASASCRMWKTWLSLSGSRRRSVRRLS